MTHGKTYNKLPRRINHKATKSKTNTGTRNVLYNTMPPTIHLTVRTDACMHEKKILLLLL